MRKRISESMMMLSFLIIIISVNTAFANHEKCHSSTKNHVHDFKYYRYGTSLNKLRTGLFNTKLNPRLVQTLSTNPATRQELAQYTKIESKLNLMGGVMSLGLVTALVGLFQTMNNMSYTTTERDTEKFGFTDRTIESKKNKFQNGLKLSGIGCGVMILGFIRGAILHQRQEQELLDAINIFNESSDKKIELIMSSAHGDQIGLKLVKSF